MYRVPDKKDDSGWRGPCELLDVSPKDNSAIVKHQSTTYIVPLRHIRPHIAKSLFSVLCSAVVFFNTMVYERASWPAQLAAELYRTAQSLLDFVDAQAPSLIRIVGRTIEMAW